MGGGGGQFEFLETLSQKLSDFFPVVVVGVAQV